MLERLIDAQIDVRLVCLPGRRTIPLLKTGRRRSLPMAGGGTDLRTVAEVAAAADIDLWRVGDFKSLDVQAEIQTIDAALVVVACYHRLIPAAIYEQRTHGGVNVHPSLLPDKRGPDPLFWIFRADDARVGATVHRLSERFDSGDILMQAEIDKPDGASEAELDGLLATLGATLLLRVIAQMDAGTAHGVAQRERRASWAPHPQPEDYHIDASWTARGAANFFHGVADRSQPIAFLHDGRRSAIKRVHGWHIGDEPPPDPPPDAHTLRLSDGWLSVELEEQEP